MNFITKQEGACKEDRKYYFGRELIAKNRNKRCNQEDDSLIDIRRIYLDAKLKVKPGKIVYNMKSKDKPFAPGDVIKIKSNKIEVVSGYSITQGRVYAKEYYFKIKETSLIRRNSGLTIM